MREIVLDTETTGLEVLGGDRIVEIGCVELHNHIRSGQVWHQYFNPECIMPAAAFQVHGLSDDFLSDKPLFSLLARDFLDFIGDSPLIIHNASFDLGFLNAELNRLGLPPLREDRVIDTLQLAKRKHRDAPASLDALCRRYGIDLSSRGKHSALLDADLLAQVYLELLGGAQTSLHSLLESDAISTSPRNPEETIAACQQRSQTYHYAFSPEELVGQAEVLKRLGSSALWNRYKEKEQS